jgi:hypothetical protein
LGEYAAGDRSTFGGTTCNPYDAQRWAIENANGVVFSPPTRSDEDLYVLVRIRPPEPSTMADPKTDIVQGTLPRTRKPRQIAHASEK